MIKFVMGTYIPDNSDIVDKKKVMECIKVSFKDEQKNITVLDLNHMNDETRSKFIEMGGIDCFAFTPETLGSEEGKKIVTEVLKSEINLNKNTQFLNIYNGDDKDSIEKSVSIAELLLQDEYGANFTHFDINSDERILSQNLKGIKNDAVKTRENLQSKEQDVFEFARAIVEQIETQKDEYTAKHIRSVSVISEAIARKVGVSGKEIDILKIGALLHDVGKKDVSDGILKKTSRLTNEEFQEMKSHVSLGEVELNQYDLGEFEKAKIIAAEHHERFDGNGYPRGLKGEEIDTLSRIVSLADATQAMFGRCYQNGRSKDDLIAELKRCAGTQFDPSMVNILCDVLEKEPESIYVSYDKDGKIMYDVPSINQIVDEAKASRKAREDDFFASLRNDVNEKMSTNEEIEIDIGDEQLQNRDDNIIK